MCEELEAAQSLPNMLHFASFSYILADLQINIYCSIKYLKTRLERLERKHRHAVQISNRRAQTDKQERSECKGCRHIKAGVGQAVALKQDVPLFQASM